MLKTAILAAKTAAEIIRAGAQNQENLIFEQKQRADYVTRTDIASEKAIIEVIKSRFPDHGIFAEEGQKDTHVGYRWLIDPLDGTTNFVHQVPVYSISIALEHDGELVLGVVYDVNRDELFYAERGDGAYLNDQAISVSPLTNPELALLGTGFPFKQKDKIDLYLKSFAQLFKRVSAIRRLGSAALDLAYVACGRFDGFWELGLSPWDMAAGSLIIQEAGGKVSDFEGKPYFLNTGNIIAANPALFPLMVSIIDQVFTKEISV